MDFILMMGKGALMLTWRIFKLLLIILDVSDEKSFFRTTRYSAGEAHRLLHDDKITLAEFIDATKE